MGRIRKNLDDVLRDPVASPPTSILEHVRNQRTPAFNAVASVLLIVGESGAETVNEISRLASPL
jgi:hypothetical protein